MMKEKIRQSFKNMRGSKSYLFINIGGLSIAFAVFILIMLFVVNEFNFDKFNTNGDRVYRIEQGEYNQVPISISRISKETFPEVENSVMIKSTNNHWISYEKNFFEIKDFCFAENSFFEIFSVPFETGDPKTALNEPFTIVLAESLAKKIFGDKNPIGEQVNFKNQNDYTVTGVIKDLPDFHLPAKAIASFKSVEVSFNLTDENWSWNLVSYIMLSENHDKELLEKKMDKQFRNIEQWDVKEPEFSLRSFNDIYLASDTEANDETKHGSMTLLIILMVVGAFIILIASINFINLTISRGLKKTNEIHIRRILGSSKTAIIFQYMLDSVILCTISILIAFAIVFLSLHSYENLIGKELNILNVLDLKYILLIGVGIVSLGIIYGVFPSYYLTKVSTRQGTNGGQTGAKQSGFNVGLITFQYIISIILICGTVITYKQLLFTSNSNLGFNKEQVLSVDLGPSFTDNLSTFKSKLLENPNISGVSFISDDITMLKQYGTVVNVDEEGYVFKFAVIDPEFIPMMDIELLQGDNFSKDIQSQMGKSYIVNEAGWDILKNSKTKDAGYKINDGTLLGVIKNFHFESFHNKIEPMIFYWANNNYYNKALLKLTAGNTAQTINYIDKVYKEMAPESLCKYQFVDEEFNYLYNTERMMVRLLGIFSLLAIFIATLGIISLSTMAAETRTKEIGIRKVNGAKISEILSMLNKDFVKWVALAFVVATPIAYFVMNKWLESFAYKTSLSWWIFALAGLLALGIALLTVSWQSWRAATRNPVEALRYE
ncbi:ABC transporter permease [Draconibacterium halophilum]|uniref:FtsX-like permease family protein n=1 Tax=Draconibacterium halophilum TaxID=2706887 RepID=A0A6C0R9K2_9BACT|nr:ABC transporter permease [Draconibacterium halophilum]QIA06596.1 FtsX-like permease family protein [Draconibacterium halophilum]